MQYPLVAYISLYICPLMLQRTCILKTMIFIQHISLEKQTIEYFRDKAINFLGIKFHFRSFSWWICSWKYSRVYNPVALIKRVYAASRRNVVFNQQTPG